MKWLSQGLSAYKWWSLDSLFLLLPKLCLVTIRPRPDLVGVRVLLSPVLFRSIVVIRCRRSARRTLCVYGGRGRELADRRQDQNLIAW